MKHFNKALALLLVLIMALSLCACGKDESSSSTTSSSTTSSSTTEEGNTGDDTTSTDPFYVYSWNTEIGDRIDAYFKAYNPDAHARIVYVNTGGSDTYQEKIDTLLATPDAEDYPDLIGLEADYIKKYVTSDHTLSIDSLGFTSDDTANMYQYTLDIPVDERDGSVKALSWQAAPGSLMYRRSLAEKYLGTQEPDEVQEYFKDWATLLDTARLINEQSGGETKLFSGCDDPFRVYMAARESAWVVDGKLTIDQKMLDYMDFYKTLKEEGLTNNTTQWDEAWQANCASDNTFAYFGCTWFLHWTIKANCGGEAVGEGTYGDWAMCQGPQTYYWGGTWLAATSGCSDTALAKEIMYALCCDTDTMYNLAAETLDYVNNKAAVEKLVADSKGSYDFLGGQDFLAVFSPLAENISVSTMTGYDQNINNAFDVQVKEYAEGKKDKDAAIADFKAAVADTYPEVTID
jgi:hypothetical protein